MQVDGTFLHALSRELFLLHTIAGVAAAGLSVHVLLTARRIVLGQPGRAALVRRFVGWALVATLAALLLGFLIYPEYKVHVRVAFIDRNAPAVGRLFDIKEYFAILSLPLIAFLYAARNSFGPQAGKRFRMIYGGALALWVLAVCATAVIGWYTTTVHSLGVP